MQLMPRDANQYTVLTEWVKEDAPRDAHAIDIGAGDGDMDYPTWLRPRIAHITGVDPSDGLRGNLKVDTRVQATVEQYVVTSRERFDVALAVYVVEHIRHPQVFLESAFQLVRPGGHLYLLTPSKNHYFGACATAANRLGIDEWLLARLRSQETLHEHHFGIEYRLNTSRRIASLGRSVGFSKVEFRMVEDSGVFEPYFPESLHSVPRSYARLIHLFRLKYLAGTIVARLTR